MSSRRSSRSLARPLEEGKFNDAGSWGETEKIGAFTLLNCLQHLDHGIIFLRFVVVLWTYLIFGCSGELRAEQSATPVPSALPPSAPGWSEDLLERLIALPVASSADKPADASAEGLVLRSYQLRTLHLGDPGRGTNLVNILKRMLPADSQVSEDRAANTLHVLSTRSAQEAVLELISAMDSPSDVGSKANDAAVVPDEVRKALETLASAQPESKRLIELIESSSQHLEDRVSETVRLSELEAKTNLRQEMLRFSEFGGAFLLVGGALAFVLLRQLQEKRIAQREARREQSLALLPNPGFDLLASASREHQERGRELQKLMESFSIAYQADRQRGSVMLEAVAKKQGELSEALDQIKKLRQEIGENAGRLLIDVNREAIEEIINQASRTLQTRAREVGMIAESASRKMEETVGRLEVQHSKAEGLASELERTQREVDALFEKLRAAQDQARRAEWEADEQRKIAYEKAAELTKKEAALAGLSLLMQEPISDILETINGHDIPVAETVPFPNRAVFQSDEDVPAGARQTDLDALPTTATNSSSTQLPCSPGPSTYRILPA